MKLEIDSGYGRKIAFAMSQFATFAINDLMPEFVKHDLHVEVIRDSGGAFDAYVVVADEDFGEEDPRHFEIHIDKRVTNEDDLFLTLCHEMVHVKQFALNELLEAKAGYVSWKGENLAFGNSLGEYYSRPWEIEAYGLEKAIFHSAKEYFAVLAKLAELK